VAIDPDQVTKALNSRATTPPIGGGSKLLLVKSTLAGVVCSTHTSSRPGSDILNSRFGAVQIGKRRLDRNDVRMTRDKQLLGIRFQDVLEKSRRDQALNAKEFAVLAGISYSSAREWFQLPGFPRVQGVVFWRDFVEWRKTRNPTRAASPCGLGRCDS